MISLSIDDYDLKVPSVVTVGTFDGIHLGHKKLINKVSQISKAENLKSIILSFYPHPKIILNNNPEISLINTLDEKKEILKKFDIDFFVLKKFTKDFSRLSPLEFVQDILINKLNVKHIVIGYDHHFGRKREGNAEFLKNQSEKYNFNVHVIGPLTIDDISVSSTQIREHIQNCDIKAANNYLGWEYEISGVVVKGEGIGKGLEFPTANIQPEIQNQIIPGQGTYCVDAVVGFKTYPGMCNIGNRPTSASTQ
jgi:riboflavin kinase/FMN adenylyltransferase